MRPPEAGIHTKSKMDMPHADNIYEQHTLTHTRGGDGTRKKSYYFLLWCHVGVGWFRKNWKKTLKFIKVRPCQVTWESVLDDTFAARATGQLVIAILVHSGAVKVKIIHALPHTMAVTRMHLFIRRQLHHLVCVSRVTVTSPKWRDAITISSLHTYILLTPFSPRYRTIDQTNHRKFVLTLFVFISSKTYTRLLLLSYVRKRCSLPYKWDRFLV